MMMVGPILDPLVGRSRRIELVVFVIVIVVLLLFLFFFLDLILLPLLLSWGLVARVGSIYLSILIWRRFIAGTAAYSILNHK